MFVGDPRKICDCYIKQIIEDNNLETVPFDMELVDSEYNILFRVCFGEIKVLMTLMFWQNLDRLRHRLEETAFAGAWEWVRIPFSDGYGDPINYMALRFYEPGKVAVFMDMDNFYKKQLFICDEKEVVEKLYSSLIAWTSLYDDSIAGTAHNEYCYSKRQAYEHLKSSIMEEYIKDIHDGKTIWRHYACEPSTHVWDETNDDVE